MNRKKLSQKQILGFRETVYQYYYQYGRDLPWRRTRVPYHILISEIMLQQTQVSRVLEKYPVFIRAFPNIQALSEAPFSSIIKTWQGLGYNRRALALKRIALKVVAFHGGIIPRSHEALVSLPGIGEATSCCVRAFAFNIPVVFIETNIRSVFIYHFCKQKKGVKDRMLLPLIEQALDRESPREWYYALMDYGVYLKRAHRNPSRKSAHHTIQSPFEGSSRQMRGRILRKISAAGKVDRTELFRNCSDIKKLRLCLDALVKEGLITCTREEYRVNNESIQ